MYERCSIKYILDNRKRQTQATYRHTYFYELLNMRTRTACHHYIGPFTRAIFVAIFLILTDACD